MASEIWSNVRSSATIAGVSSLTIRIFSFIFLRWIPGHHFPPLVLAAAISYAWGYYQTLTERESLAATPSSDRNAIRRSDIDNVAHESDESSSDDEADVVEEKVIVHAHEPDGAVQYKKVHTADQITANKPRTVVKNQLQEESQPIDAIKVLLSGVPRARVNPWNLMTAVINALLVLMVADLTLRAPLLYPSNDLSFTRVGYVDDKSARLLLREPKSAQLPVMISYRPVDKETWTSAETIYSTIEEQDFTQPLTLSNLRPSTNYQYSTSNGHSGAFRTAPRVGHLFEDTSRFTFLTSSCIKPRFPYSPFQHPLRIPGLEHLSSIASKLQASFMLFLGDFIYIDVPQRFGWGADTYRAEYRRVYDSPSWKGASKELPWLHVIDDHEIANDWDKGSQEPYPAAIDPFSLYHHSVNPPPLSENATYYSFKQGPASFFMIDSRRYRSDEFALPADHPEKTMLGKEQLAAVLHWLSQPEPHGVNWKIFVSSIPFTRNWRVNAQDTWAGYLAERQTILEAMWDATSSSRGYGIIILSGDRHEFAATRFPAPPENEQLELARVFGTGEQRWLANAAAYEFSVSPASMFYLPVRSYWENTGEQSGVRAGGEDQVIAYLPDGNSKFGAVEIENTVGSKQSVLRYRLFVDGEESWSYVVTSGGEKGAAGKEAIWN